MADYYCQDGLYPAYAASPAFGTTQDGDGLASGTAVCATVSIDLTGMTVGTGTLGVLGASVAITAGWTAAQIASAINGSSANTTAVATGWTTPYLKNAVYATFSGNVLQIQTRAGSASYNGSQITAAGITGWPGTNPAFSGGVSGAWGYLFNDFAQGTLWQSGVALYQYGCLYTAANAGCIAGPIAGLSASDSINERSTRAGAAFSKSYKCSATMTLAQNAQIIVDDGTIWPADTSGGLTIAFDSSGSSSGQWGGANGTRQIIGAKKTGRLTLQLVSGSAYSVAIYTNTSNGSLTLVNAAILDNAAVPRLTLGNPGFNSSEFSMLGGSYTITATNKNPLGTFVMPNSASGCLFRLDGVAFDFSQCASTLSYLIALGSLTLGGNNIDIRNCSVKLYPGNSLQLFGGYTAPNANTVYQNRIIATNLPGFSVNSSTGLYGSAGFAIGDVSAYSVLTQGVGQNGAFRLETIPFMLDILPGASPTYPTPTGAPFAWGLSWSAQANAFRPFSGADVQTINAVPETTISALALEMLMDPAIVSTINRSHIAISAEYLGTDGAWHTDYSSGHPCNYSTAALTASSAWASNGGYSTYTPVKLPITLSAMPVIGSPIDINIRLFRPAPSGTLAFISPVVSMS